MGMCAIAHIGNTRYKNGQFYKVIIYVYCIYFHLFLLYNLKFLEYSICKWKRTRIWSRPCQCLSEKKLNREGQIFPGGHILLFFIENVKYRKVIKGQIIQNRPHPYFGTFLDGVDHCSRGQNHPNPLVIFFHVRCRVRDRVSVRCSVRVHVLGRVSVHDRRPCLLRCMTMCSVYVSVTELVPVIVPVSVAVSMLVAVTMPVAVHMSVAKFVSVTVPVTIAVSMSVSVTVSKAEFLSVSSVHDRFRFSVSVCV